MKNVEKNELADTSSEFEKIKGKRIKDYSILTNIDGNKVKGFDLIFEDDSELEVYSLTCDKLDEKCKEKEITLTEYFTDKKVKTKNSSILGGGMGFVFATKEEID